jgi:Ni,Fe-hydrogenase maturation factor
LTQRPEGAHPARRQLRLLGPKKAPLEWHQMKVYVFGNKDVPGDKKALEVAKRLEDAIEGVSFVFVGPNEDAPFVGERHAVILDTVNGIEDVVLIEGDEIDALILSPRGSVHDFDLAFQLRYLKKLDKLGKTTIIGVPQQGEADYSLIQSILRKLVAHDIQGS